MPKTSINTGASAFAKIIQDNHAFVKAHAPGFFKPFQREQTPYVTLLMCADSRCQQTAFAQQPVNNVFEASNIGNRFSVDQGTISYGVYRLNTPLLLVVGHTDCGAIKGAMRDYSVERPDVKKVLDSLQLSLCPPDEALKFDERVTINVIANINVQVNEAVKAYEELIKAKKLLVIGSIHDIHNQFGAGYGWLHIFNLNGVTAMAHLSASPLLLEASEHISLLDIKKLSAVF